MEDSAAGYSQDYYIVDADWILHREGKVPASNENTDYIEQYKYGIAQIEYPLLAWLQKEGDKCKKVEEINEHPGQQGTEGIQNVL